MGSLTKKIIIIVVLIILVVIVIGIFILKGPYIREGEYGQPFALRPSLLFGFGSPIKPGKAIIHFPDFDLEYISTHIPSECIPPEPCNGGDWGYDLFTVLSKDKTQAPLSLEFIHTSNSKEFFSFMSKKFILTEFQQSFPGVDRKFIITENSIQ